MDVRRERAIAGPADRVSLLAPAAVNAILARVRAAAAAGRHPVSLLRGEPDWPTPGPIVAAAQAAIAAGETRYAPNDGLPELRQAIAESLVARGLRYDPEHEILVTDGATLGFFVAALATLDPGQEAILLAPHYDAYATQLYAVGARPRPVPAPRTRQRFEVPAAAVEEALNRYTRAIVINTPWNPTGRVLTRSEIYDLLELADAYDLLVFADEIYGELVYPPAVHVSVPAVDPAARERVILVQSFSKTYAMTGWRLGYVAADARWIAPMRLALQQMSRGPARFVQRAGIAALREAGAEVAAMRAEYAARRDEVATALSGVPRAEVLLPEGGFFALVDVSALQYPTDALAQHLLDRYEVAVMPGSAYGPAGEGLLRVSFAVDRATLREGLGRLAAGLTALALDGPPATAP